MTNMLKKASEIIDLFQDYYCRPDGLLGRKADCINGYLLDSTSLVDEIGDYCQYCIQLGQDINSQNYIDWGLNQVTDNINKFQNDDGLIYNKDHQNQKTMIFFPTLRMGDTFWGLQETFRLTGNNKIKKSFDKLSNTILKYGLCDQVPSYGICRFGKYFYPLPIAEPMTSGYLGESLIEMYKTTGDEAYLNSARKILESWQPLVDKDKSVVFLRKTSGEDNYILKWILNKQFKLRGRPSLYSNILTKGDVFLLFAWLALYRINKDPAIKKHLSNWVDYIDTSMTTNDGRFFNHYDVKSGKKYSVKLEENHSIIELLIDISVEFKNKKALDIAMNCALSWYKNRSAIGLVANTDKDYWAEIDPFLDLLVNIAKLRELSKDTRLDELFEEGISSLLKNFKVEYGYVQKVKLDGSGPINGNIELKYMGLLIKGLIITNAVQNRISLFESRKIRLLATDR